MRDVNNTGFKLVLGRSDWQARFGVEPATEGRSMDVVYDEEGRCATLDARTERFPRRPSESVLGASDRTSAARDRYGSWYWIDPDDRSRIVVRNAGDDVVDTFWSTELPEAEATEDPAEGSFQPVSRRGERTKDAPPELGGLTITTDHRLVVGQAAPAQLLVFDLHAGGPPQRIAWFGDAPFRPRDATPRPDGGLYLLERAGESGPADGSSDAAPPRIWALDRALRPEGHAEAGKDSAFRPVGASASGRSTPASTLASEGIAYPGPGRPLAVEALPDDTILVLCVIEPGESEAPDVAPSKAMRYRWTGGAEGLEAAGSVPLTETLKPEPDDPAETDGATEWETTWQAYDLAFVPGSPTPLQSVHGELYVAGADGNQAYVLRLRGDEDGVDAENTAAYVPLRRFSGKGLVEAGGEVYYDLGDRWLTVTAQRRSRFVDEGTVTSAPFDSEIAACTWHRVFLDACIPTEAEVRLESRASDRPDRLSDQSWQPEPAFYQRDTGSEIPYHDPYPGEDRADRGTWEVLLQNAEGRYVQLRLTLSGNGQAAPRIRALRAYYPRFSYLDEYLPDVYQKDEVSASFVERFLAITEGTLTDVEGRIAAVQALFDVRTVPDEYLDWLATWFGASFDPALDARRKRLFLDHAVELFRQRGTLAGLARMLTLVLDPCADETLFTRAGVAGAVGRPEEADERTARGGGVRIVEAFAARDVPRATLGDARAPEQPAEVRVDEPWTPTDGAGALQYRFRQFLQQRYAASDGWDDVWESATFPPLRPASGEANAARKRADWEAFVRRVIDGPYAAIDAGSPSVSATRRFRAFLQRRYRTFDDDVPALWRREADGFASVSLPRTLPTGDALTDWMHFAGAVLPMHRAAHRFRVLVPVDPDASADAQTQRLDLARRVVETQKPAHTDFEVLPYWAAFRAGTARTGIDTVLGTGSRYAPLLVGEGALAEETVGASHPQSVPNRRVTGRDTAGDTRPI
jgi:phage tail-like protein